MNNPYAAPASDPNALRPSSGVSVPGAWIRAIARGARRLFWCELGIAGLRFVAGFATATLTAAGATTLYALIAPVVQLSTGFVACWGAWGVWQLTAPEPGTAGGRWLTWTLRLLGVLSPASMLVRAVEASLGVARIGDDPSQRLMLSGIGMLIAMLLVAGTLALIGRLQARFDRPAAARTAFILAGLMVTLYVGQNVAFFVAPRILGMSNVAVMATLFGLLEMVLTVAYLLALRNVGRTARELAR